MIGPSAKLKIHTWDMGVQSCAKCGISTLCKHKVPPYVYTPYPSKTIDILFVGEAPGQIEYAEKETFIGPSGSVLRDIIAEAVPPHLSYCLTNAVVCTPFLDDSRYAIRTPSLSEVKECSTNLARLIKYIHPKTIIAVGKIAEKALTYIPNLPKKVAIRHPSFIMQSNRSTYEFDNAVLIIRKHLEELE